MIIIAVLTSVMFFGGWLSPFQGIPFIGESSIFWLLGKTSFFLFMFLWLRATFPRYRYDQIMRLGWKIFIPITIVWLIVAAVLVVMNIPPWFTQV
jgi:NADH-quinone oxidoreductase subunit H